MFDTERRKAILSILQQEKRAAVADLARRLYASESTIRRDLKQMEAQGLLGRAFGGALALEDYPAQVPLNVREGDNALGKKRICKKAAELIREGDVIFIDASSTSLSLSDELKKYKDILVLTNSPKLPLLLSGASFACYCTGGQLLSHSLAYVGVSAVQAVEQMNADLFFFSARGLSEEGQITDSSIHECQIKQVMLRRAKRGIFLCAREKQGKKFAHNICTLKDVHQVIFDD